MRHYKKHLLCLSAIWSIFMSIAFGLKAEDLSAYQLVSVRSDNFYYNIEYKDQALFLGSDAGIWEYQDPSHIRLSDPLKKGYISLEKGEFKSYNYLVGNNFTPHYKMLLPAGFRHNSIIGTNYKNSILIISKGQLFIFKKTIKPKADTLSIRTISPHYIGSYSGIFSNGKRFFYPEYTNGYIREYSDETFICYDGLLRIRGKDSIRYEANSGSTQIGKYDLGKTKDIFKIDHSRYLLFTEKGLAISDLKTQVRWILSKKSGPEPRFVKAFYRDQLPVVIYFIDGNKLQKFNLLNQAYTTLLTIDPALGNIEDVYFKSAASIYLLTENKLISAISDLQGNAYSFETLVENLIGNHHIYPLNNLLLVSSNDGLSTYNLDSREWIPNLIHDEFNQRASYRTGDTFFLGTINGYYELNKAQIDQLISWRLEDISQSPKSVEDHSIQIIYGLVVACILLLVVCIFLFMRSPKTAIDSKARTSEIMAYIDANLKDVTIVNICHEFNINPVQLNELLGNDKPGELIRAKRLELVKKMRKDRRKEEEIAQVTGFSVSYLKKIKTS